MTDDASPLASNHNQSPAVAVEPLLTHIATLEQQVQHLTKSATRWEIRALQVESRLTDLELPGSLPDENDPLSLEARREVFAEIPEKLSGIEP